MAGRPYAGLIVSYKYILYCALKCRISKSVERIVSLILKETTFMFSNVPFTTVIHDVFILSMCYVYSLPVRLASSLQHTGISPFAHGLD